MGVQWDTSLKSSFILTFLFHWEKRTSLKVSAGKTVFNVLGEVPSSSLSSWSRDRKKGMRRRGGGKERRQTTMKIQKKKCLWEKKRLVLFDPNLLSLKKDVFLRKTDSWGRLHYHFCRLWLQTAWLLIVKGIWWQSHEKSHNLDVRDSLFCGSNCRRKKENKKSFRSFDFSFSSRTNDKRTWKHQCYNRNRKSRITVEDTSRIERRDGESPSHSLSLPGHAFAKD